jgi:hypothetical protein
MHQQACSTLNRFVQITEPMLPQLLESLLDVKIIYSFIEFRYPDSGWREAIMPVVVQKEENSLIGRDILGLLLFSRAERNNSDPLSSYRERWPTHKRP